jgi:protoheme IX farnesyltransferase
MKTVKAYWTLCKPNVVALMLLTSTIGMLLATESPVSISVYIWANLGIAFCAGAAATINHIVDKKIDQKMLRTYHRPMAKGEITALSAIIFSAVLSLVGLLILSIYINLLTAILTALSLLGYALIYTGFLKRATPQNIVIGGLAGASPPLLGWTAVTGEISAGPLLLALIIYVWTPPHFWALAVHRKEEYAYAGIPMLPVTHGDKYTKLHILLYTVALFAVTLLPFSIRMFGMFYLLGAVILGIGYLYYVVKLYLFDTKEHAMNAFWYSIIYLMVLFIIMLIDHYGIIVR